MNTPESVTVTIDDTTVEVAPGTTILEAVRRLDTDAAPIPTLCFGETIRPRNACRVCMVEVVGSPRLVPACSRPVEAQMVIRTRSPRVDHSRKMVLEFLATSVDLSLTDGVADWMTEYGADVSRYGDDAASHANVLVIDDNNLFVRDYAKCILCYQCVDACGAEWQHSFAIDVAGRGWEAHISTEHDRPLDESACVFCGNCIAVCPTGALIGHPEFDLRARGEWLPDQHTFTDTICGFCGVGCNLRLRVQDHRIVDVTSPTDSPITHGNLCIKGRFGFAHVQPQHTDEYESENQ